MENNKTQKPKNQILSTGQATSFEDELIAMGAEIIPMPSSSAPIPEEPIEFEGVKVNGMAQSVLSAEKPIEWLFTDFIETGEQIIIAGAPKTGKSLLAAQLGLALASGGEFLGWKAVGRRKVLYVNMEIKEEAFARRVIKQIKGKENRYLFDGAWFDVRQWRTVDRLKEKEERAKLESVIKFMQPDLIIFDILARLHNGDEQSSDMKAVMQALRQVSQNRTHIIVHHTRKPSADSTGPQTAMDIRGSSALFGEVDTALVISKRAGQGARFVLTTSARSVELPDEILLNRDENLLFYLADNDESDKVQKVFESAFKDSKNILATDLKKHIQNAFLVKERRAADYISKAVNDGWISRHQRSDRQYEYTEGIAAPWGLNQ